MPAPAANPPALKPLHAGRCFRVDIEGSTIGVFATCTGLRVEYDVVEYVEGGLNDYVHKLRGVIRYPNLVLTRGITSDTGLLDWMMSPKPRTVTIALVDEQVNTVRTWAFSQAFPVRWDGPTLSDEAAATATETLEIAHNGLVTGAVNG
jgi:phage tail-like protein